MIPPFEILNLHSCGVLHFARRVILCLKARGAETVCGDIKILHRNFKFYCRETIADIAVRIGVNFSVTAQNFRRFSPSRRRRFSVPNETAACFRADHFFKILPSASARPAFGSNRFDFARAAACRLNFTLCEAARLQILKFAALALVAFDRFL